jgi:hypothetical protein
MKVRNFRLLFLFLILLLAKVLTQLSLSNTGIFSTLVAPSLPFLPKDGAIRGTLPVT